MDGRPVELGAPKQRALLATLLLHRNEVVQRDRLVEALWGERPPASAAGSLQVYVHNLRRALGSERIVTHGTGYRLRVEPGELDLDGFEQLLERGARALSRGEAAGADEDLRAALALCEGAPLGDVASDGPLAVEAARLEEQRLRALELRTDADLALGRNEEAAARLGPLVAAHPFRERLREQQMLALYRCGRQGEALEAYRAARRTLVEELGVEPGPALQQLERAILHQDPALAPPRAPPGPRRRLPRAPTPLVGRYLEIAAVTSLLRREEARLVTLTGAGGSGKTRLALAVAEELAGELADGAVFVDLAPIADEELLLPAIAGALEIGDRERLLEVELREELGGFTGLLLLDNFEQLLPAAPRIAELLATAPRLRVLVTSRAPLRLSWEHEYPVPPLEPPEPGVADPRELRGNDAVRLFAARAQAADPSFVLDDETAVAVAAVCRRLDGLPLALELAAARSKVLRPAEMARELERMLPLLTGGAVDLPPRQRALEATLDWSLALLPEPQRILFRRLGVFAGGFTPEAAAAVAGDLADDLPLLATLADHSLLRRIDPVGGQPRFRLLRPVREYALARLREAGEEEAVRLRHAGYFASLAEGSGSEATFLAAAEPSLVLDVLEAEHDNLRAALAFLHDGGAAETELRLADSLAYFWRVRAHLGEGRMWLEAALTRSAQAPAELRARALSSAGRLAYRQGDLARARTLQEEALSVATAAGDDRARGQALSDLGGVSLAEGDLDRAESLYTESAEVLRAADHRVRLGTVLGNLAGIRQERGDLAGARRLAEEARALQEETGDKEGRVFTHLALARIATASGDTLAAAGALQDSLELIEELDYREVRGAWFLLCAELAWHRGDLVLAARLVGAADAGFERAGISRLRAEDRELRASVLDAAAAALGADAVAAALATGRELPDADVLAPL